MTLDAITTSGSVWRVPIAHYPDKTPLIDYIQPCRALLLRQESADEFLAAMFFLDAMRFRGMTAPHLICPLFPGSRQDRLNYAGDVLFAAKSFADMVNARNLPSVTILDPHSEVTPALIDRCRLVHVHSIINPPAGKYSYVVAPDAGAAKRAQSVANKLGVPLINAWKTRDVRTGRISGFGMQPVSLLGDNRPVLVVDDLCDAGGTFLGLADCLDENGLTAHLWTTHGLFTKGTSELLKRYSHVYCSDSAIGPRDGVIEVKVCDKLLRETV